jgi:hypothetical protein
VQVQIAVLGAVCAAYLILIAAVDRIWRRYRAESAHKTGP